LIEAREAADDRAQELGRFARVIGVLIFRKEILAAHGDQVPVEEKGSVGPILNERRLDRRDHARRGGPEERIAEFVEGVGILVEDIICDPLRDRSEQDPELEGFGDPPDRFIRDDDPEKILLPLRELLVTRVVMVRDGQEDRRERDRGGDADRGPERVVLESPDEAVGPLELRVPESNERVCRLRLGAHPGKVERHFPGRVGGLGELALRRRAGHALLERPPLRLFRQAPLEFAEPGPHLAELREHPEPVDRVLDDVADRVLLQEIPEVVLEVVPIARNEHRVIGAGLLEIPIGLVLLDHREDPADQVEARDEAISRVTEGAPLVADRVAADKLRRERGAGPEPLRRI
jgi:hypothetical protein